MTAPGVHSAFAAEWSMFGGVPVTPACIVAVGGLIGFGGGSDVDGAASEGNKNGAAVSVSSNRQPAGLWR